MLRKTAIAIFVVLWGGGPVIAEPSDILGSCRDNYQSLRLEAAIEDCTTAVGWLERRSDSMVEALITRGLTHFDLGRLDLAIADLTSAIDLDAQNTMARNSRGTVFDELGLTAYAIRDYSAALEIDPGFAEAYSNRAIAYLRSGASDLARRDAETAFRLKPDDPRIATVRKWLEPGS